MLLIYLATFIGAISNCWTTATVAMVTDLAPKNEIGRGIFISVQSASSTFGTFLGFCAGFYVLRLCLYDYSVVFGIGTIIAAATTLLAALLLQETLPSLVSKQNSDGDDDVEKGGRNKSSSSASSDGDGGDASGGGGGGGGCCCCGGNKGVAQAFEGMRVVSSDPFLRGMVVVVFFAVLGIYGVIAVTGSYEMAVLDCKWVYIFIYQH
jgi:MFS family permease